MRTTILVAGLCAAVLGTPAPVLAQHVGHDAAPAPKAMRADLGASAAFSDDGTLWAVSKQGDHAVVQHSRDRGVTWSPAVAVNTDTERVAADGDSRPKIAVGKDGALYVTWTRPLAKPYTGEVRFARSLDGGASWSEAITVHADRQEITHRFDALAVDGEGRIFVAWIDKRDQELARATGTAYRGAAVYFAVSDDGGASFRGDFKVAEHSCECCRIALLAQPEGGVLAMWRHVFAPNIRDHAVARLNPDGSIGPMRRATFDGWAIDACPHHGPSLARDRQGRLHAVWFNLGNEAAGVFYGRLVDGAVQGQRRVGGDNASHADIAVSGDRVAVVWTAFDGERMQLQAMQSDDGGEHWHEQTLASTTDMADQARLLVHDGRFYAFWNTREQPLRVIALDAPLSAFDATSLRAIQAAHAGQPFVLALWSVYCEPCREELRTLARFKAEHPHIPVVLVATDPPEEAPAIAAMMSHFDLAGIEIWAFADAFVERLRYAVDPHWKGELPRSYLHDSDHHARAVSGRLTREMLDAWLTGTSPAQ